MRGAVILIDEGRVALIRRERRGQVFYLFPGGMAEAGESATAAAIREAHEELGLHVALGPLVAEVERNGRVQYHYLATRVGGEFGTGNGEEFQLPADSPLGNYIPCWLPVAELCRHDVRPARLANALQTGQLTGLTEPLRFQD